jgi:hypothetical protein
VNQTGPITPPAANQLLQVLYLCNDANRDIVGNSNVAIRVVAVVEDLKKLVDYRCEPNRSYSTSGGQRMVTPLCSRLDAELIGMCQVFRSWLRAGVIDDLDVLFLPVEEMDINQSI